MVAMATDDAGVDTAPPIAFAFAFCAEFAELETADCCCCCLAVAKGDGDGDRELASASGEEARVEDVGDLEGEVDASEMMETLPGLAGSAPRFELAVALLLTGEW